MINLLLLVLPIFAGLSGKPETAIQDRCVIADATLLDRGALTDTSRDTPDFWIVRTDNSHPTRLTGILNGWLAPAFRVDVHSSSGAATGSHAAILAYMPDIDGKGYTTLDGGVMRNASTQQVAVVDSSVFAAGESASVEFGGPNAELVKIVTVPDSKHVTGVFRKNHSSGAKIGVLTKGDKIGIGSAVTAAAANTDNIFAANLNASTSATGYHTVAGNEIDVSNNSGVSPDYYGGATPYIIGEQIIAAGTNDSTQGLFVHAGSLSARFLTGAEIGSARRDGVLITNNGAGITPNGLNVFAASNAGLIVGSNQNAPANPRYTATDPTYGVFLTSQGREVAAQSNSIAYQERVASADHVWETLAAGGQLIIKYDGTATGLAFLPDGSTTATSHAGGSRTNMRPEGILTLSTTRHGTTADANEHALWTYELPADVLTTTARGIRITVRFHGGGNAHTKTFRLYFGDANVVMLRGPAPDEGLVYEWTCEVIRTGPNAQVLLRDQFDSSSSGRRPQLPLTASQTETGAISISFTGQGDAGSIDDVVFDYAKVEALN